jgi:glutaredoxin 3
MSAAKTKAQNIIDENAVAVFSKSYCPYCKATKALLSEMGANYYSIELDQVGMSRTTLLIGERIILTPTTDDGAAIQDALKDITNQSSVPNIFIGKKHIGGNSDLQAKKSNLKSLLTDAGAL